MRAKCGRRKCAAGISDIARSADLPIGGPVTQCRCGRPEAQAQQPPPAGLQAEGSALLPPEAKTENLRDNFAEPQWGHLTFRLVFERTRISLSCPHFPQWNS
jgi:hypothetical protein